MYQPKLGRFMSRDPMPENGVTVLSPVPDLRKYVGSQQSYADGRQTAVIDADASTPRNVGGAFPIVERRPAYAANNEPPYAYALNDPINKTDPSGLSVGICVFKFNTGRMFIDCSCKGILNIWIVDEKGSPAGAAKCGQWIDLDGYAIDNQLYKVDGSTCCKMTCTPPQGGNPGQAKLECQVNYLAQCLGKKGTYPVPWGAFGGPPKEPKPNTWPPPVE